MATGAELAMADEIRPLLAIATQRHWKLEPVDPTTFSLTLPAKDGTSVDWFVECNDYPALPPAWHVKSPTLDRLDNPSDFPKGGSYFHSAGVICAPWNRLSYAPRGPHSDWAIGNWRANPQVYGTTTLAAMALRIAVELQSSYQGRLA